MKRSTHYRLIGTTPQNRKRTQCKQTSVRVKLNNHQVKGLDDAAGRLTQPLSIWVRNFLVVVGLM